MFDVITHLVDYSDVFFEQDFAIFEVGFNALSNLANNEQNQTNVGASNALKLCMQVCCLLSLLLNL